MNINISLEDFDDDDIVEYAEENLGMFQEHNRISDMDTEDLIEELSYRNIDVFDFDIPHTIMSRYVIKKLYDNIDKVNILDLEQFLKRYYD